jgi:hypothetical protein
MPNVFESIYLRGEAETLRFIFFIAATYISIELKSIHPHFERLIRVFPAIEKV